MTNPHYPQVEPNPDFARVEESVLEHWRKERIFAASVEHRPSRTAEGENNEFVFYDGPPFANGLPHYGHLLTGFVKDLIARYQTMKGKRVERRFGWDCHGLPAEMGAEKELKISGRQQITEYGIGKFNDYCRTSVMKYTNEWEYYVTRQGRWVDFKNDYKTMDTNFMESVLWAFKQLYDKGLVYEAYRVMPYSWAAETPLSNFETKLDNAYRERTDKAITVAFELKERPKGAPEAEKYYILAWTTTPWTLPSNLALAVSREMEYVCVTVDRSPLAGEHNAPWRVGGGKTDFATEKARAMRKEPTDAEKNLWQYLRGEQLGYKFRRQQPIGHYIVDFYNPEKRLVIEADGGQHAENAKDEERTKWLEAQGLKVLRFWNNEVLQNIEGVLTLIKDALDKTPHAVSSETAAPPQGGSKICYLLAKNALPAYEASLGGEVESHIPGAHLIGLTYKPLFPYFQEHPNAFRILDGSDFITEGDGTGVVHMAPGFGEDDQRVCAKNNISVVVPVDGQGRYTDEIYDIEGLSLKGLNVIAARTKAPDEPYTDKQLEAFGLANLRIIQYLKQTGQLIKQEDFKHNYPHCWRTDTPIIYRALSSWYVAVTKFRDRAVEINRQINWIPSHVRDGAMGHMLATAPDWSISRNRFWGTPIPVWRSDNPENEALYVFGSIAELEKFFGVKVEDLHRPFIDELTKPDPKNPKYTIRRVEDVFDCWFESGSMPYAQVHYPFENRDWFENHFPADFITEYVGQTRGWFNTLIMLSTALFDKPPFLNCICHGVVIDEETGLKYSKRLKNYKDPKEVMDKFGADALRWLMIASPVMRGADLGVDPEGKFIRDVVRLAIKPIWNAYNFFCLYANADGVKASFHTDSKNLMDRYILAKAAQAVKAIEEALDAYETPNACQAVVDFFEVLNNWYIRRNKERFWKEEQDADKQAAYDTLYTVLHLLCRAAAPLLPMTLEEIYRGLTQGLCSPLEGEQQNASEAQRDAVGGKNNGTPHDSAIASSAPPQGGSDSVHLADFPDVSNWPMEKDIIMEMDRVRDICNAGLAIRNRLNIRVRQPLNALLYIGDGHENEIMHSYEDIIRDELNIKSFTSADTFDDIPRKLSINFPVLGKRLPEKIKQIIPASKKGEWKQLPDGRIEVAGEVLEKDECQLLLEPKPEYKDRAQPLSTNDALVILDTTITPELEAEGIARDVVRMIQQARKDAGLHVSDRIALILDMPPSLSGAVKTHERYIAEQTLAVSLTQGLAKNAPFTVQNTLDGEMLVIGVSKVA